MDSSFREINGITIIGEDFLARDHAGKLLNTLATVFPRFQLAVTGRNEIHGMQVSRAIEYLQNLMPDADEACLAENICRDAVCINIIRGKIVIRIEQDDIAKGMAADLLLQRMMPKAAIQFTGLHIFEVRRTLRRRGEIWRFSTPPIIEKDFTDLLFHCKTRIETGMRFLHNKHTGEHILTYQEAESIRRLFPDHVKEALTRIREIIQLRQMVNQQGYPELSFLVPAGRSPDVGILEEAFECLTPFGRDGNPDELTERDAPRIKTAQMLYDRFLNEFAEQARPELLFDDPGNALWRAMVLCRLYNIDERTTAEWALGLGPEFYLHIRWLPGAMISEDGIRFEPETPRRVKRLIEYYRRNRKDFVSINVGSIVSPLTDRNQTGEEREVLITTLTLPDDRRDIRHIRMSKWDVVHRLKLGLSLDQAINETGLYRDFIMDRLAAIKTLGLPIPEFQQINIEDEFGTDIIPVYYFEREYIPGIATDKIPSLFYSRSEFLSRLAFFLGQAAAASMVIGRIDYRSMQLYYDDGDEIILVNTAGLPCAFMLLEITGSFKDWTTPVEKMLPHCIEHLARHMSKARQQGVAEPEFSNAIGAFAEGVTEEIQRMQTLLDDPAKRLWTLFADRSSEAGGIRDRWEGVLNRLGLTDAKQLKRLIHSSSHLKPFIAC